MVHVVLVLIILGEARATFMQDNVVFQKVNEISTTRSRWLVTIVNDLEPFEIFLKDVTNRTAQALKTSEQLIRTYSVPEKQSLRTSFYNLQLEADDIWSSLEALVDSLIEIQTLDKGSPRKKRALLPLGSVFSFLFGVASQSDLKNIKQNIKILRANQQDIAHVVEKSLTIINTSRVEISENRQAIGALRSTIGEIDKKIEGVSAALSSRINQIEFFLKQYLQMELIVGELSQLLQKAMLYLEHLRTQLNMLSLGHLSPSVITPSKLSFLLARVKEKLPVSVRLPVDPSKDLWKYYHILSCTTIFENNKLITIVKIPLLDVNEEYEIFKVHNLPLPYVGRNITEEDQPNMVARYQLEADYLGVNAERTNYMLLTGTDVAHCSSKLTDFCQTKSPVYPVNLSKLCVMSLFMGHKVHIGKYCTTEMQPNTQLPTAQYLDHGQWVVATQVPLKMSIVCQEENSLQTINPPIALISLNQTCSASNDYLTLPPYFHKETSSELILTEKHLFKLSNMSFTLWEPFSYWFPNFTKTSMPPELNSIEHIPIKKLISQIHNLRALKVQKEGWPWYVYFGLVVVVLLVIVCAALFVYIKYFKMPNNMPHKMPTWSPSISQDEHERLRAEPREELHIREAPKKLGGEDPIVTGGLISAPGKTVQKTNVSPTSLYPRLYLAPATAPTLHG